MLGQFLFFVNMKKFTTTGSAGRGGRAGRLMQRWHGRLMQRWQKQKRVDRAFRVGGGKQKLVETGRAGRDWQSWQRLAKPVELAQLANLPVLAELTRA